MKISEKKKKLLIILAAALIFLLIYHFIDAYKLLQNPISGLRLGINIYEYSGTYSYDELNGNSQNVFVKIVDKRKTPAEFHSISSETSEEIEKLLSEYEFTMEHYNSEGKGSISNPDNSLIILRSPQLSSPEFISLGNGAYSYGIGSVAVLENKVIINKCYTKENWLFDETDSSPDGIIVNTTLSIAYSCKDSELIEKINQLLESENIS